ncbi:MAG: carboxypeptidase regulatory-like domain-containing protein [Methanobrevibacter sp.]|nr:carboxypeptidase regulatory-like domain-containing protein [Methanobrevibacter sp.]
MNSKLIIAIIIVLILAVVGVFALTQNTVKADTQINFLSETTLKNGDQVQFVLTDAQGNPIANAEVTIAYESDGEIQNYTIITDSEGKGGLMLSDQPTGEHKISVSYNGNEQYNGCSAEMAFTIEEGTSDNASDSSTDSTAGTSTSTDSSSDSSSDSGSNVYTDDDGIIHGGQNDGLSEDSVNVQQDPNDFN